MGNLVSLHADSDSAPQLSQRTHSSQQVALSNLSELHPAAFKSVSRTLSHDGPVSYPAQSFRFLDLPAELRLHIAAYAVAGPFKFCWTVYKSYGKFGSFKTVLHEQLSLGEPTARTCAMPFSKKEARRLIGANDELMFDQQPEECLRDPESTYIPQHSTSDGYKHILETFPYAVQYFPQAFRKTRHVVFETFFSECISPKRDDTALRFHVLARMIELAASLLNVTFQFRDLNWCPHPRSKEPSDLALVTGRKLKAELNKLYGEERNWRLYPSVSFHEEKALVSCLNKAARKELREWIGNGI